MKKYNLLLITPFYPPVESVATNRMVAFCKYLKHFNITVLTRSNKFHSDEMVDGVRVIRVPDRSLFKKATFNRKTNVFLHNIKALYNRILLFTQLDEYDGWRSSVFDYINKNKPDVDVVVSSFAPISTHIIALYLKNLNKKIVWVADMRDHMSSNIFFPERYRKKIGHYEGEILSRADIITAVSKPIIEEFEGKTQRKDIIFLEIRNGYDFEPCFDNPPANSVWTVTYTGTFYGLINPDNFLKGVKELLQRGDIDDIRINFVGVTKPMVVDELLKEKVHFFDKVSNKESIDFMRKSDALLLIHPTSELKGVYTGKLFEYIGVVRPILALVDPDDVAADLIKKGNFGFVADNNDIEGIKKCILKCYDLWKNGEKFNPDIELVKTCHRRFQVEILEKRLMEELEKR
jgi:glycosyltransferase involved in cell wall biosynthesis